MQSHQMLESVNGFGPKTISISERTLLLLSRLVGECQQFRDCGLGMYTHSKIIAGKLICIMVNVLINKCNKKNTLKIVITIKAGAFHH